MARNGEQYPGTYIVIEGPDGSGKTTQATMLVDRLSEQGVTSRLVHEPGETPIGHELERVLKDKDLGRSALTALLLFTANRVELWEQVLEPELREGTTVVADRNWLSSIAYQGVAGQLGTGVVYDLTKQHLPRAYLHPTFTAMLYTPEQQRAGMLTERGTSTTDYFESQPDSFQMAVLEGYTRAGQFMSSLKHGAPKNSSAYISAEGTPEEVHNRLVAILTERKIIDDLFQAQSATDQGT